MTIYDFLVIGPLCSLGIFALASCAWMYRSLRILSKRGRR